MKKVVCIFAVVAMSVGVYSCESDSNLEETDAVYELHVDALPDGEHAPSDGRD